MEKPLPHKTKPSVSSVQILNTAMQTTPDCKKNKKNKQKTTSGCIEVYGKTTVTHFFFHHQMPFLVQPQSDLCLFPVSNWGSFTC